MRSAHRLALGAMAVGIVAAPRVVFAQAKTSTLVGWIRDAGGHPLTNADVTIGSMNALARTDSTGRFILRDLDAQKVEVMIRRLGFDAETFDFTLHAGQVDSVAVQMQQNAQLLDEMRTNAALSHRFYTLEEFYKRRDRGGGAFLTRAEIEQHHTTVLTEVLREVPGIRIVRAGRNGKNGGVRFQSARANCPPELWIDGQRAHNTEVDDIIATDVEAMELYPGPSTTPMEFSQQSSSYNCGTIVIWTRLPGTP